VTTYWFAALIESLERGDRILEAMARRELRERGFIVRAIRS
jgi:hypothetical protein